MRLLALASHSKALLCVGEPELFRTIPSSQTVLFVLSTELDLSHINVVETSQQAVHVASELGHTICRTLQALPTLQVGWRLPLGSPRHRHGSHHPAGVLNAHQLNAHHLLCYMYLPTSSEHLQQTQLIAMAVFYYYFFFHLLFWKTEENKPSSFSTAQETIPVLLALFCSMSLTSHLHHQRWGKNFS